MAGMIPVGRSSSTPKICTVFPFAVRYLLQAMLSVAADTGLDSINSYGSCLEFGCPGSRIHCINC